MRISLKIVGAQGQGIDSVGEMLARNVLGDGVACDDIRSFPFLDHRFFGFAFYDNHFLGCRCFFRMMEG